MERLSVHHGGHFGLIKKARAVDNKRSSTNHWGLVVWYRVALYVIPIASLTMNEYLIVNKASIDTQSWYQKAEWLVFLSAQSSQAARNDPTGTVSMVPFAGINAPPPLHFHQAAGWKQPWPETMETG
ncbi:hypothetical protein M0804_001303 [Polistes exclamans]|nr:hypothetical protein M0804_001303 [Polistes exclamans]